MASPANLTYLGQRLSAQDHSVWPSGIRDHSCEVDKTTQLTEDAVQRERSPKADQIGE